MLYFYLLTRVIQTYWAQRGSKVSKSKLSNNMWTPIKVDYNYVFEDQIMFYLKVNTNYIVVFLFWCSSVQNNPMAMIVVLHLSLYVGMSKKSVSLGIHG